MMVRGKTDMIAPEEVMVVGMEIVLIGTHIVQCIVGADQVLTMGGLAAQFTTGTMVHHMIDMEALDTADIGAPLTCEKVKNMNDHQVEERMKFG
ncbi:unnamed protein product [Camellia sinensis]